MSQSQALFLLIEAQAVHVVLVLTPEAIIQLEGLKGVPQQLLKLEQ